MTAARPPARRSMAGGTAGGGSRVVRVAPIVLTAIPAIGTCLLAVVVDVGGGTPLLLARAATRVLLDLSAAAVLGTLAVVLLLRHDGRSHRLLDVAAVAAGVWTVTAATTAFLLYLGQAPSISSPAFGPGLVSFLSDVVPGRTWLIATVAAAVLTTALVAVRSHRGLQLLALLATGALVPVAAQSAPSDQSLTGTRTVGAAALVVLVAVGTWIGVAAITAGLGESSDGRGRRRFAGLTVACGASAAMGLALGGVQLLPLGIAAGVALLLALGTAGAGLIRDRRRLLPLQLVLLGTAAGLAAAARVVQSAPPPGGTRTTPAEILTGAPLPGVPTVQRLLLEWQPDAVWLLIGAGLLVAYVGGIVRLRRAGSRWPARRVVSLAAGVLLLVWLTCGGPAVYAPVLLSAHLAQHAAMAAVVPLLLAAGAPLRLLSSSGPRSSGRREVGLLGRPLPAAVLAAGAIVVLYGTELLRWSVTDAVGTEWGLLQCLLAGCLLSAALLNGSRRTATRVTLGLLLVETLAAALLTASPGLLLADRFGAMGWGTDALADQRLGAGIAGAIAVLATLVLLAAAVLRRTGSPSPGRADLPANPAPRLEVSA